jgi:hypothetical protein
MATISLPEYLPVTATYGITMAWPRDLDVSQRGTLTRCPTPNGWWLVPVGTAAAKRYLRYMGVIDAEIHYVIWRRPDCLVVLRHNWITFCHAFCHWITLHYMTLTVTVWSFYVIIGLCSVTRSVTELHYVIWRRPDLLVVLRHNWITFCHAFCHWFTLRYMTLTVTVWSFYVIIGWSQLTASAEFWSRRSLSGHLG